MLKIWQPKYIWKAGIITRGDGKKYTKVMGLK
jgi:hypothetical protein